MTRAELDELIDAAITAMIAGLAPDSDAAAEAREEAQLLEAEARSFADAVDRDGKHIPYGNAVVLEGSHGIAVVTARDYTAAPIYWRTVAGKLDRITDGTELLAVLQAAANRGATAAS